MADSNTLGDSNARRNRSAAGTVTNFFRVRVKSLTERGRSRDSFDGSDAGMKKVSVEVSEMNFNFQIENYELNQNETDVKSNPLRPFHIHLWRVHHSPADKVNSLELCKPLLKAYLGESFQIVRNKQGKPTAWTDDNEPHPIQFNITHSGDLFFIAFIRDHHIGIDVERRATKRPWSALAKRFFAEPEFEQLHQTPSAEQEDFFYELWTLKEALIKCLGISIFTGLERARFSIEASQINLMNPSPDDSRIRFYHVNTPYYLSLAVSPAMDDENTFHR